MNQLDKMKILIEEFVAPETVKAVEEFTSTQENNNESVDLIAQMFGYNGSFTSSNAENNQKQVTSFQHNLKLLIQKTWVEKDDITLKEEILFKLDELCKDTSDWKKTYSTFLEIIGNAVYLMFGQQTKSDDFGEYSLRIDPEFGIFWWYIQNLPTETEWSNEKYCNATLLGMYFLANY